MLRVDSHQHFWQLSRGDYRWLTPELKPLYRDFSPDDLREKLRQAGIDQTVLIQAADSEAETRFMLSLAEQNDFITGVVGWVDMASTYAADHIGALAKNPYLKGIRPMIQDIQDPDWMLKPELDAAFTTLIERGLCFDALVLPCHLNNLLTLLHRYPDLKVVVDHGAKPDIASGNSSQWMQDMSNIAEQTNVFCKISGLVTEAGDKLAAADLKPYVDFLCEAFGPSRLMWGSDWPVLELAMSYAEWNRLSMQLLSHLSSADQQRILGLNAIEFYQLQEKP